MMMKPYCHELDWQATATSEHIKLSMSFKDFEQSQRFVALLIKFIQDEREQALDVMPDVAWHCPPGLFSKLTPEQRENALAYRGEESHGDPAFFKSINVS